MHFAGTVLAEDSVSLVKGIGRKTMVTSKINLLAVIVALVAVTGNALAQTERVPDVAGTLGLFSIAIAGLAVGRQLLRK